MNQANEKSHVSLEQHQCPVCCDRFDTGAVLLDRRLRPIFGRETVTGHSLCPQCDKLRAADYVAIIEVKQPTPRQLAQGSVAQKDIVRTGRVAHVRRAVIPQIFNCPISDEQYMAVIDEQGFELLITASELNTATIQ